MTDSILSTLRGRDFVRRLRIPDENGLVQNAPGYTVGIRLRELIGGAQVALWTDGEDNVVFEELADDIYLDTDDGAAHKLNYKMTIPQALVDEVPAGLYEMRFMVDRDGGMQDFPGPLALQAGSRLLLRVAN